METTIKSNQLKNFIQTEQKTVKTKTQSRSSVEFWQKVEFMRFGIIPIQLFVIGCVSGIAASFGAHGDALKLSFVAFPTIIALALTLAGSPMKAIIWTSIFAIVLDLIILFI